MVNRIQDFTLPRWPRNCDNINSRVRGQRLHGGFKNRVDIVGAKICRLVIVRWHIKQTLPTLARGCQAR